MNESQKYFKRLSDEAKKPREELERKLALALNRRGDVQLDKIGNDEWRAWQDAKFALEWHDRYSGLASKLSLAFAN